MEYQVYNLPPFKCAIFSASEGREKWLQWKRGFLHVVAARGVEDKTKLKSMLLSLGGFELQDVFYSIPGADVEAVEESEGVTAVDPYKVALEKLDEYFAPNRHESYERFAFWSLKQDTEEPFEKFALRIQQRALKCKFGSTEQEARDRAVMDKVILLAPLELREKLLARKDMTLSDLISQVNIFQAVKAQAKEMGHSSVSGPLKLPEGTTTEVNQVQMNKTAVSAGRNVECFRCGRKGHYARDSNCPAKDKMCMKCRKIGHFAAKCRQEQQAVKRSATDPVMSLPPAKKSKVNAIEMENKTLDSFIYNIGDGDERIWCRIGGILVEMLIDSGSSQNIIDEATWTYMVNKGVNFQPIEGEIRSQLRAYAQKEPLKIVKVFKADIALTEENCRMLKDAIFYVISGGSVCLLGRSTAKSLGVLIIGLPSTRSSFIGNVKEKRIMPFPKMKGIKIVIPIDDTVTPVSQHARRPPIALLKKVEEKLEELLRLDIIEPVNEHSAWVSPIVVCAKMDGDIRIRADVRQVNKAIKRESQMMPWWEDYLPRLESAKCFSRLALKDAFYQMELDLNCRHITTFITHKGLFRYKRLWPDLKGATEIFQKTMEQILAGCRNVMSYVGDIIVFGNSLEEHDHALDGVLVALGEYEVVLDQARCVFRVAEICFQGYVLSEKGISLVESKVEAVQKFRAPETKEEIRSLLELVTYVSRFLPDCSTTILTLRQLMCSSEPFKWEQSHQEAFEELRDMIGDEQILSSFRNDCRTRLVADASPVALGAILLQFEDDTEDKPLIIAYASKKLSDMERKFCQTEREALALVWSVEKFFIYLSGREFELITDHKPLELIFKPTSKTCARIERWLLRLQAFQFKVIYKKGSSNIADPLSRLSVMDETEEFETENVCMVLPILESAAIDVSEIVEASIADSEIQAVREALESGSWTEDAVKPYQVFKFELGMIGNILVRGNKMVVPKGLRPRMMELAHEGHPGETAMKKRLRERVWWPGMDTEIVKVVKCCEGCRLVEMPNRPEPMLRKSLPEGPWIDLAIDFLGPLPSGEHILVVVDYYSRYKEIEIMNRITAKETVNRLAAIFTRLGYPRTITLDNAKQFVGIEFPDYCKKKGIILNNTIPYWPQQNGEVERQNRSLLKRIKISHHLNRDWKKDLQDYLVMYYSTPHSTTGKTPTELCYGRTIRTKIPSMKDIATAPPASDFRDRDQILKEKGREAEDRRRRAKKSGITEGDVVLMKNLLPGNKLQTTFGSKEYVVKQKSGAAIIIEDPSTSVKYKRNAVHLKKVQRADQTVDPEVITPQESELSSKKRSSEGVVTRSMKRRREKEGCGDEE